MWSYPFLMILFRHLPKMRVRLTLPIDLVRNIPITMAVSHYWGIFTHLMKALYTCRTKNGISSSNDRALAGCFPSKPATLTLFGLLHSVTTFPMMQASWKYAWVFPVKHLPFRIWSGMVCCPGVLLRRSRFWLFLNLYMSAVLFRVRFDIPW